MSKECNGRCIKNSVKCDDFGKCYSTSLSEKATGGGEVKYFPMEGSIWCNKVCIGKNGVCSQYNTCDYRKDKMGGLESAGEYADQPTLMYGA